MLALCFALSVLGRGLGESFTVFLKPISEDFGWDRAQVVSVYSLTWLAGGLTAPLVGRLFDRSGPRIGLRARPASARRRVPDRAPTRSTLWQFQLSVGLCVGLGIALIGNVPNSILLGRWFGPRLPTAMAIIYSATGAGILVLLPASQLLIDRIGWRDAYQLFGGDRAAVCCCRCCCCRGGCSPPARRTSSRRPHADVVDDGWTLASAMRHHAFWALFSTFFFTAVGDVRDHRADRRLSDRCRLSAAAGGDRLGFSGVVTVVRHARHLHARRHHRPPAVGAVQLRRLDRRHHPALAVAVVSELLAAHRLRGLLRQHDRFARPADHGNRAEHLSRQAGRDDLRHDLDRQRARIGIGLLERRPDP